MKTTHTFYAICLTSLLYVASSALPLHAQDTTYTQGECIERFGATAIGSYNQVGVSLKELQGVPTCCAEYNLGNAFSLSGMGEYQKVLSQYFSIGASLGFGYTQGIVTANETKTTVFQNVEEDVFLEHRIENTLLDALIAPFAEYRIANVLPLQIGAVARIPVYTQFHQSEHILAPSDIFFENNRKDRLHQSGSIPALSPLRLDARVSLGYTIPLRANNAWSIIPRVEYSLPLNNVVQNGTWNLAAASIGVSVLHNSFTSIMHISTPEIPKPVEIAPVAKATPKPKLEVSIQVKPEVNSEAISSISILSKAKQAAFPLLPYIFFDDSSSQLATRYKRISSSETNSFSYRELDNEPDLDRYCHILNIIGKRLQENPTVSVTIRGCNSNTDREINNTELSLARATTVRNYLQSVWGIDSKRMKLESRNLPVQFSNTKTPDGIEENRRVEIIPSSIVLDLPVITNDTTFTAYHQSYFVLPTVQADSGIRNWALSVEQANKVLWKTSGSGLIPTSFSIPMSDSTIPRYSGALRILLSVTDNLGNSKTALQEINVTTIQDTTVTRKQFTLVLFDYNSAELTPLNKRIAEMVKQQLKANSVVSIVGFADRSGNFEYNKKLALRRSEALATLLRLPSSSIADFDGSLLMDNSLPEGRYFCRTVRVNIEDKR